MKALGAYLREMRKGQRMTQAYVASQTGINPSTLHRIEKGETEPGGENALNLVAVVMGSYEDARRLWSNRHAGEEEGREAAAARLERINERPSLIAQEFVNDFSADELALIRAELAKDPTFIDAVFDATAREILKRQW